jgi:uncharacterized membrane protein YfcA
VNDVLTVLLGFAGGTVGGLLGVGGGILFVPALAAWRQHGYGNVRLRDGLLIGALSPLGVAAGVVVANAVSQRVLELSFAALALAIAARLTVRALRPSPDGEPQTPPS